MRVLQANKRTIDAIRRADSLPRILPGGVMAKGVPAQDGSDLYNGAFKIVQKDATTIQVFDYQEGEDYSISNQAGSIYYGLGQSDVLKKEITITVSTDIIVTLVYDGAFTSDIITGGTADIPGNIGTYNFKIGSVIFDGSAITSVTQSFYGPYKEVIGRG